jgi:thymidylate synthase
MTNLVGSSTIEIINASFIADEPAIFGEPNKDYIKREEEWYYSKSLSVNDIPGGAPSAWKAVADKNGFINSNYGWIIFSKENGLSASTIENDSQYARVYQELSSNPESRRAVMIYTRPSMWLDYNKDGRSDYICTNSVQYLIRDGALHAVVQMRSNDAVWGYKNDYAWQFHVLDRLSSELNVPRGNLFWNVGSLHVYERHYHLVSAS